MNPRERSMARISKSSNPYNPQNLLESQTARQATQNVRSAVFGNEVNNPNIQNAFKVLDGSKSYSSDPYKMENVGS